MNWQEILANDAPPGAADHLNRVLDDLPEQEMNTKNQNQEIGDRNNRAAVAMRQQGDMQAAERFLQVAEYYWNLAAKAAREE